jgi:prevent-host-death family protein
MLQQLQQRTPVMRSLSIRELNSQVSQTIAAVEAGEEVVITRNGRPVARLVRERTIDRNSPEWQAAFKAMVEGMERGIPGFGGPATYEERTE